MKHKPIVISISPADFKSPSDFTATYLDGDSLTIAGLPAALTITDVSQFVYIKQVCTGREGAIYENASGSCWFDFAANVLTIHGCGDKPFSDGDKFEVGVNGASILTDINVDTTSVSTSGMIGKPVGGDGDFTTAYASATTITCAAFPVWYANLTVEDIITVQQINAAGTVLNTYSRDDMTMSVGANVITVVGATFGATDSFVIYTNVDQTNYHLQEIEAALENGGAIPVSTHRSPTDFTAAFTSNITITLVGLPFAIVDNSQLVYIKQITAANTSKTWINAKNCTLTEAGGVITIHGGGTPFVAADDYEVGINSQDKAYDPIQSSDMVTEQAPVWDHFTGTVNLVNGTDIGAVNDTWIDQGSEIDMKTYTKLALYVKFTVNNSTGNQLQVLSKHTSAGADEYPMEVAASYQKTLGNADMVMVYIFTVDNEIPYVQIQTKATLIGAVEGTIIIDVRKSWV